MSPLRVIGRVLATFIVLLFVVILPALLYLYNAQAVLTSRAFLETVVTDERLLDAAFGEAADDLARSVPYDPHTRDLPIAQLDAQAWRQLLGVAAPQDSVERWAGAALEAFDRLTWSGGRLPEDLVLPFGEIRDNLVLDSEQRALHLLAEAQPPCADGQAPLSGAGDLIPRCRPSGSELAHLEDSLAARWQQDPQAVWQQLWPGEVGRLTEDMTLADLVRRSSGEADREIRSGWRWFGWGLAMARVWFVVVTVVGSVLALGLVAALAARTGSEFLRWTGGAILLAGLGTLAWGLVTLLGGWTGTFWGLPQAEISTSLQAAAEDILVLFSRRLFGAMAWQGALLTVMGLALWGGSFLAGRTRAQ